MGLKGLTGKLLRVLVGKIGNRFKFLTVVDYTAHGKCSMPVAITYPMVRAKEIFLPSDHLPSLCTSLAFLPWKNK